MSANRHLGRIIALQTLYEYDFRKAYGERNLTISKILGRNISRYKDTLGDQKFVSDLTKGSHNQAEQLDTTLQPIAPERPLNQIARIDRIILHLATYELMNLPGTPPKVVINEAVELAKSFGGDNSSRFVNGVLGTLLQQQDKPKAKKVKGK